MYINSKHFLHFISIFYYILFFGGMVKLAIIADLHSAGPESYSGTSTKLNSHDKSYFEKLAKLVIAHELGL